jgi:hypothetical protein
VVSRTILTRSRQPTKLGAPPNRWAITAMHQVEHDGTGMTSSWFLETVAICQVDTGRTWLFEVNAWVDAKGVHVPHGRVAAKGSRAPHTGTSTPIHHPEPEFRYPTSWWRAAVRSGSPCEILAATRIPLTFLIPKLLGLGFNKTCQHICLIKQTLIINNNTEPFELGVVAGSAYTVNL